MFFHPNVLRRCRPLPAIRLCVHFRSLQTSGPSLSQNYRKTHYETLGLTSTASQSDIKGAYYKLSMKYHPDKNQGDEDRFKELTTAYEVLGNPRMRRLYDRGIISHHDDDDTISQHAGTDSSASQQPMGDQSESSRVSAANYDKWAKEHASSAFSRAQTAKRQKNKTDSRKERFSRDTGSESLIWGLFFIGLILMGGYSQVGSSKKSKSE